MKKVLYILMLFAFSIDVTAQYTVVRRNSKTAQPSKTITPNSKSARNTSHHQSIKLVKYQTMQ